MNTERRVWRWVLVLFLLVGLAGWTLVWSRAGSKQPRGQHEDAETSRVVDGEWADDATRAAASRDADPDEGERARSEQGVANSHAHSQDGRDATGANASVRDTSNATRGRLGAGVLRAGLCPAMSEAAMAARGRYLGTFIRIPLERAEIDSASLYAAPTLDLAEVERVVAALRDVGDVIERRLGLKATPPTVFLYPSLDALREHSCVTGAAVAYYDGAIHLAVPAAGPARLGWPSRSLRHELTHHLLMSSGIRSPLWFQEGAAMASAEERWRMGNTPLSYEAERALLGVLDHAASEADVEAVYGRAHAMHSFVTQVCRHLPNVERRIVQALLHQAVEPEALFEWATSTCTNDLGASAGALWDQFLRKGGYLDTAAIERIQQRVDLHLDP